MALVLFAVFTMGCFGLLLIGIGSIKQARLAKRMFNLRYSDQRAGTADESESD